MKNIFSLIILFTALLAFPVYAKEYIPYSAPSNETLVATDNVTITYPSGLSEATQIIYANGRLCVPFYRTVECMGMTCDDTAESYIINYGKYSVTVPKAVLTNNRIKMYYYNNTGYIYLYELIEQFGFVPVCDTANKKISIERNFCTNTEAEFAPLKGSKKAYIRLEDIAADGNDTSLRPLYSLENVEKLRYTAQYLYSKGQQYYVAFIPLYVNGKTGYTNDVTKDFNLYNSYFLYVLDYIADHNGHIGAHGYSHQYGTDISGEGYEWGENTPYSYTEQQQRMIKARQSVERLGYKAEFFEFPHYGATDEQIDMASNYYNVIYQSYNKDTKLYNFFTYSSVTGRRVYFMPTPADYVHNMQDGNGILKRITSTIQKNYTLSLFYHPAVDVNYVFAHSENGVRKWNFSNKAILSSILNYINLNGYTFSKMQM